MKDIMNGLGKAFLIIVFIVGLLVVGVALRFLGPVLLVLTLIFLPWVILGIIAGSKKGGDKK